MNTGDESVSSSIGKIICVCRNSIYSNLSVSLCLSQPFLSEEIHLIIGKLSFDKLPEYSL